MALREESLTKLSRLVSQLGELELAILVRIAERLWGGQQAYGPFADDDPRDFVVELLEEVLDAQVYAARELMRRGR